MLFDFGGWIPAPRFAKILGCTMAGARFGEKSFFLRDLDARMASFNNNTTRKFTAGNGAAIASSMSLKPRWQRAGVGQQRESGF
jgi:hypothetical protein